MTEKLNIVCVYFNFSHFEIRKKLTLDFIKRYNNCSNIDLYIVEIVYNDDEYEVTDNNNKNHMQLKTNTKLWYKENLINLAIKNLLPPDWTNVAWIDSDIEFTDTMWVEKTIEKLKYNDIIQLFSSCIQLDKNNNNTDYISTGVIKYNFGKLVYSQHYNNTHPGYAWALSRTGYDKIGKIPELFIIGSADTRMSYGMLNIDLYLERTDMTFTEGYKQYIINVYELFSKLRFDYLDCIIHHYYHGDRKNRKYFERHLLLSKYEYDPNIHIEYTSNGLIKVTDRFPKELLEEIEKYFDDRKEDD
jgi:hypothetical protein